MEHQIEISDSIVSYLHTLYIPRCIFNTAKCEYWLRRFCPSAWNSSAPTGQILMKFEFWGIVRKPVENIQVLLKSDKDNGYST